MNVSGASDLVSVVMPVFNGEQFLAGAIENVLAQDYRPLELIVVDDGATDGTPQVAARFEGCVRYVRQANRGPAAARNLGLTLAAGAVVAFLDVDDLWAGDMLSTLVPYLAANPPADIVQGLVQDMQLVSGGPAAEPQFTEVAPPYPFVNLGSAVYRRGVFDRVGLFDEFMRFNEDTDWYFRAWENDVIKIVVDKAVLFYRKHARNMTLEMGDQRHIGLARIYKKHLDRRRVQPDAFPARTKGMRSLAEYLGWVAASPKEGNPTERRG